MASLTIEEIATASATERCRTSPPSAAFCAIGIAAATNWVELVVRWFVDDDTTHEARQMIVRVGCRTRQPGLRSLGQLDPATADDVRRRLIDVLRDRMPDA